jgi:hypothetical protein
MAAASSLWQVQAATVSQCWFRSCPQHSMDQPTCSLGQGSHGQLAARPGTCTADGALTSLLDVVHIPTIGVLVFQHLDHEGRKQARLASRDLCMLVRGWKHTKTLHLQQNLAPPSTADSYSRSSALRLTPTSAAYTWSFQTPLKRSTTWA